MRIASSEVQVAVAHQLTVKEEERASLRVTVGGNTQEIKSTRSREGTQRDAVAISDAARHARAAAALRRTAAPSEAPPASEAGAAEAPCCERPEDEEPPALRVFRLVIEALTRREIRATRLPTAEPSASQEASAPPATPTTPGWSSAYDYTHTYEEREQTSVRASGVVNTADGKQIAFAVAVDMQRSYSTSESVSIREGQQLRDPLVLQFDGPAGALQSGTFAFDIDADGKVDDIHFVPPGSAALALDKNHDGTVNDGGELLGTRTGDGFAELAEHDVDGNGWIDEGDPVFDELRLWSQSADGKSRLSGLRERGVGAISLSAAASPFQIKDAQNQLQGVVRATGVWLSEDGRARAAQQIDLVV